MEAQHVADDQSHYEISLTASQAFLAFVLLLLSLSASFAFGLMIGRGQSDERLVVRREPAIVTEGSVLSKTKPQGRIVELGVENSDFQRGESAAASVDTTTAPMLIEEGTTSNAAVIPAQPQSAPAVSEPVAAAPKPVTPRPEPAAAQPQAAAPAPAANKASTPVYAQLLSTGDQKRAEALAAKLIEGGFNSAYVERGTNNKGPVYRVRVRFNSEAEARAAEPKLKSFSPDAWIDRN